MQILQIPGILMLLWIAFIADVVSNAQLYTAYALLAPGILGTFYILIFKKELAAQSREYSKQLLKNMDPKVRAKRYTRALVLFPIIGFAVLFYGVGTGEMVYSNFYLVFWVLTMIWFFFGLAARSIADQANAKGKNWVAFFWLSILISPLVTWLIVSSIQPEQGKILDGNIACPMCAEPIKAAAKLCKHCGSTL
jgi:hypothetical protein